MPDASDILKDPTKVLDMALHTSDARLGLVEVGRLHRHIQAGGALPEQWRGEGTAVGALVADPHSNARIFEGYAKAPKLAGLAEMANMTRAAIRAVTGEG